MLRCEKEMGIALSGRRSILPGAQSWGMAHRNLNVIAATERVADHVNRLIDHRAGYRLLYVNQLRASAQSIGANIAEGFGRGPGPDRTRYLRIARGEAEETIRHLGTNFRAKRIGPQDYWSIHNLLVVIVKMLDSLIHR